MDKWASSGFAAKKTKGRGKLKITNLTRKDKK